MGLFRRRQCPPAIDDTKVGGDLYPRNLKRSAAEAHSSSDQAREEDARSQDLRANVKRQKVLELLDMYKEIYTKLAHKYEPEEPGKISNARRKARTDAAMCLKRQHKCINTYKQLGHIPGVEVGDRFQFRAELYIIGLHCQLERGIDFIKKDGVLLATSIVESNRYSNFRKNSNSLTYIGHGGNPRVRSKKPTDQKLEQGNLAMMNSMKDRTPVRVVLKDRSSKSKTTYTYDGLYIVEKMTQVRGEFGKLVFSFFLTKTLEQPSSYSLWRMINKPKSCEVAQREVVSFNYISRGQEKFPIHEVVCSNDISQGQEKFPIRVVTSILDDDLKLTKFDYIVSNMYPQSYMHHIMAMPQCCDCIDRCMDSEKCACAIKNGGRGPYNFSRKLHPHQTHSLIYECGPSCKCSSSCINRVSQFGMQFQLEIFRTSLKCWAVRTRSFIPVGSFVCEYVGEVCLDDTAEPRRDVDNCSFTIGLGKKGFIDATHRGNVARFINHSCSPNLCVKDVLYDHDDEGIPHKMLFALKNIPAGQELCIDYRCLKRKV